MKKKVVIITGASSGMGREFAIQISKRLKNMDELWLIARRKDRLLELRDEINMPCLIIDEDITDSRFSNKYKKIISQEKPTVKMLINCAGYGVMGKADEQSRELELGMIDTNCKALTNVTMITLPFMDYGSRIINLASSAAFLPQSGFAIYAASKSYVLSFSRALSHELKTRKIFVTAVCPGPVNTEFFRIAENGSKRAWFKDYFMANPQDVVRLALKDSIARKEVSVYGVSMKLLMVLSKICPHRLILNVMDILNRLN